MARAAAATSLLLPVVGSIAFRGSVTAGWRRPPALLRPQPGWPAAAGPEGAPARSGYQPEYCPPVWAAARWPSWALRAIHAVLADCASAANRHPVGRGSYSASPGGLAGRQ